MKPHKHAAIIKAYADRAQVSETPWDIIEYREPGSKYWTTPKRGLGFDNYYEFRIKPRTINISGFEVPEPVKCPLECGIRFFKVELGHDELCDSYTWDDDNFDEKWLSLGIIHLTKGAAQLHAKALLSFTKK